MRALYYFHHHFKIQTAQRGERHSLCAAEESKSTQFHHRPSIRLAVIGPEGPVSPGFPAHSNARQHALDLDSQTVHMNPGSWSSPMLDQFLWPEPQASSHSYGFIPSHPAPGGPRETAPTSRLCPVVLSSRLTTLPSPHTHSLSPETKN